MPESRHGFARLTARALVVLSHHSLAAVGLVVAATLTVALSQPELRTTLEAQAVGWLQLRQDARTEATVATAFQAGDESPEIAEARNRTTASAPSALTQEQAAVASWIAKRYKLAVEPVARLVLEAWSIGPRVGLEPALILAVAAVESAFNPFAQGSGGAKGLMQVVAHAHLDKFEPLGGLRAAFDPVSNLRVGAQVLKEHVTQEGSVEAGLMAYVNASGAAQQASYVQRVLGEQMRLQQAADRGSQPVMVKTAYQGSTASPDHALIAKPAPIH